MRVRRLVPFRFNLSVLCKQRPASRPLWWIPCEGLRCLLLPLFSLGGSCWHRLLDPLGHWCLLLLLLLWSVDPVPRYRASMLVPDAPPALEYVQSSAEGTPPLGSSRLSLFLSLPASLCSSPFCWGSSHLALPSLQRSADILLLDMAPATSDIQPGHRGLTPIHATMNLAVVQNKIVKILNRQSRFRFTTKRGLLVFNYYLFNPK